MNKRSGSPCGGIPEKYTGSWKLQFVTNGEYHTRAGKYNSRPEVEKIEKDFLPCTNIYVIPFRAGFSEKKTKSPHRRKV